MSSHHVVKEKQEPGLLILDAGGFDREYLGQLLEWSPTIVVADTVLAGDGIPDIKVDGVVTADQGLPVQAHARLILSKGDPLHAGLQYFLEAGYPALNIIRKGFDPGDYSAFVEKISLVVFSENRKYYAIRPGFSKWKTKGELIEAVQPAPINSLTNLEPVSDRLFRVKEDGFCSFSFAGPFIFVAEEL